MNRMVVTRLLLCGLVAATVTGAAFADFRTATVKVGDPLKAGEVELFAVDAAGEVIPGKVCRVLITADDLSAERKAAKIKKDCTVFDFDISVPGELTLKNLNPAIRAISFWIGATQELPDELKSQYVKTTEQPAKVGFENPRFDPFASPGQPAIFVAGIVTDVGELTAQVSSQELNFQTEGPIICQALFQRLAPRAPQYGAQINYAGDRLEIYFDSAYTVTQGGVIFGTTSPSPGCSGSLPLEAVQKGDLNCDGVVDFADIDPFVLALSDPAAYQQQYPNCDILTGDCNGDGSVDFGDIDPFVAILSGG